MTSQNGNDTSVSKFDSVIEEISGSVIAVRTLKGVKKFDIGQLFKIDQNEISSELSTQASMYGFFAILAAEADRISAMQAMLYEQETASADESYRANLDEEGKKYTEAVIKSMVARDEDCIKVHKAKENADYDLNILKAIVRAFEQRAMMLQSLGSQLRHEYDMQGMNVKERELEKTTEDVKSAITERRRLKNGE
jgi:hypothetical protein